MWRLKGAGKTNVPFWRDLKVAWLVWTNILSIGHHKIFSVGTKAWRGKARREKEKEKEREGTKKEGKVEDVGVGKAVAAGGEVL